MDLSVLLFAKDLQRMDLLCVVLSNQPISFYKDPELRKKMGHAGRSLSEEAFAIDKIVEQHMVIYRELLEL